MNVSLNAFVAMLLASAVVAGLTIAWPSTSSRSGQAAPLTSGGFTTNATVTPSSVAPGQNVSVVAQITSAAASTALVDVEIYNPAGTKAHQVWFDNQTFTAGQQRSYTVNWIAPATTGTYAVRIGVFVPGWQGLLHWNNDAGSFVVAATTAPTPTATTPPPQPSPGGLPALPAGWPASLQLGTASGPGGAAAMKATAPYGFRYQYLAGGVNTGAGWANWNPDGAFVTNYVQESIQHGIVPVFTYYMLFQSAPGSSQGESSGLYNNLQNTPTMAAYYADLKLFFQRAGAFPQNRVVLHVEPDLWGYMQQRSSGDDAETVPAKVASTGMAELAGLPENLSGFALAIDKLRDTYAPNVILAYHVSVWGTGNDITYTDPPDATVDQLGQRAGTFFASLSGGFDIAFAEFSDRDAAFKQYVYGDGGASWWNASDFARNVRFLTRFMQVSQKRIVMWQIPQGNTKMRAMNNTWNHYQDNRVEWLLDDPSRAHLQDYVNAGVVAFLFGRGADGATCSCDANNDGVTNPAPINGNDGLSLNADDDGGFFVQKAQVYYAAGAMPLTGGGQAAPTATATATRTPTPAPPQPTNTPTATRTATPVQQLSFMTSATVSKASVRRGQSLTIRASVLANQAAAGLVDIEIRDSHGQTVHQQVYDAQTFSANDSKQYSVSWIVPRAASTGKYTVVIGVFSSGWGTLHHWNSNAAQFTVRR